MDLAWLERVRANDRCWTKLRLSSKGITAAMASELADAMKNNTNVTSIELTDNQIGDEGCWTIAASTVIRGNSTLRFLELGQNQITSRGVAALAQALVDNQTLQELDLSENEEIGKGNGIQALADALPKITGLVKLELAETNLGDDGLVTLVKGLQQNRSVTWLGLRGNHIGPTGAMALANDLLMTTPTTPTTTPNSNINSNNNSIITSINLRQNQLGVQGMRHLANALQTNHTLTELDVTCNHLGVVGAQIMATVLVLPNISLHLLFLGENQLGDDGMEAIAMALKENTSVTYLDVHSNDISFVGADALEETFRINRTLTHVLLHGNDPGVVAPPEPLDRNRILRNHGQFLLEQGPSLFVRVVMEKPTATASPAIEGGGNHDDTSDSTTSTTTNTATYPRLEWTEELWKGTKLDEPIEWVLIHRVLQVLKHASSMNATTAALTKNNVNLPPWPFPTGQLLDICRRQPHALVDLMDKCTNDEGSNLLHVAISAESPVALDLCKYIVSDMGANIDRVKDAQGRSAREIGMLHSGSSEKIQEWARCVGYFLHRYQVEGGSLAAATPVYRTEKGTAHFARDAYKSRTDPMAEVMLYLVDNHSINNPGEQLFAHEVCCRLTVDPASIPSGVDIPSHVQRFQEDYVVPLIRFHDELDESGVRYKCLVFPLLERSLQGIIDLERIACCDIDHIRDIVTGICHAVHHVHHHHHPAQHQQPPEKPVVMIHGNLEPRNIIRSNGSYKLMGFDMAVLEGEPMMMMTNKRTPTVITSSCPPELARILVQVGDLEDLTTAMSDLRQQQLLLMDTAVTAAPEESKRLLEILSQVQLLRKKMAILEMLDNDTINIIETPAPSPSQPQLPPPPPASTTTDFIRSKRRNSISSSQHRELSLGVGLDLLKSQNSSLRKVDNDISEPGLWNPRTKQIPGEQSWQESSFSVLSALDGTDGLLNKTLKLTHGSNHSVTSQLTGPVMDNKSYLEHPLPHPRRSLRVGEGSELHLKAHRTFDIWSLGVTMYKLFTGEDLFPINHDGHLSIMKDQIDLAMWQGMNAEQLGKILSRCQGATTVDTNLAKDLVSRCLHPEPSKRPQTIEEILSHRFLSGMETGDDNDDGELLVSPLDFSFNDETPRAIMPLSFVILPCKLFISEQTGKLVAPAQAKDAIDKFAKMQELAVLQHLLTAKYKENDMETEQIIKECRNLDGKEAAERLLKYMQISESSVDYFIDRIQDVNEFKKTPSTFIENKSREAFHEWWHAYSGRAVYFYLIDEFFFKPVATSKYPIELQPRTSFLRDLLPLFCLRKTQIPILSASAFLLGRPISLPGRLNDWALAELNSLNGGSTMADYNAHKQAVNKLGDFSKLKDGKDVAEPLLDKFGSVDEAMPSILETFFGEYDRDGDFSGLRRVVDRDGSSRWTCEVGAIELEQAKSISVTETISRRRQLEEALHEAQATLQRVSSTAKRLVDERDALQREKLSLVRTNKGLEDYIEKEMKADAATGCCTIL